MSVEVKLESLGVCGCVMYSFDAFSGCSCFHLILCKGELLLIFGEEWLHNAMTKAVEVIRSMYE